MSGPWEDFSSAEPADTQSVSVPAPVQTSGPWEDYQTQSSSPSPTESPVKPAKKEYSSNNPADEPQFQASKEKKGSLLDKFGDFLFGAIETTKDPLTAMRTESMGAHLASAYEKGTFDKPVSELWKDAENTVKFDPNELYAAVKREPGKMFGHLLTAVEADPALLLPVFWEALGGRMAILGGKVAGKAGAFVGKTAEVGATGGAVGGGMSAASQLDEQGFIDPSRLASDMKISAGAAAALSAAGSVGAILTKGKAAPAEIVQTAKFNMQEGDDIMSAMDKAMASAGVGAEERKSLVEAMEPHVKEETNSEGDFAKMRQELKPLLEGEEAVPKEMTSKQAQADLGQQAKAMEAERLQNEASSDEFSQMRESLQRDEAKRVADEVASAKITTQEALAQIDSLPYPAKQDMTKGVLIGSAEAARVKPEFARTAEDLVALRAEEQMKGRDVKPIELTDAWKQRGVMDPEMVKWMAAGLGGAALGGYLADDKAKGMALGAALALGGPIAVRAGRSLLAAGKGKLEEGVAKFRSLQRDPAIAKQIDDIMSAHQSITASVGLASDRLAHALEKLVPSAERRAELIHVIQEGRVGELRGNEKAAAELFQHEMATFGDAGQKAGVLDDIISDGSYVTQLWKDEGKARAYYNSMKGSTRFAEDRLIPSYKEGMARGLEPQTLDLAEIARIYGKGLGKAMANKELLDTLKTVKVAGTETRPVMRASEAPADYVQLPHPQLQGYLVNPEMAPSLSYLFHSNNIPTHLAVASALSATAKQGLLGLSGFHAKSLLEVGLGMALGLVSPKTLTKVPEFAKMLREGKAGDFVDMAVRNGLQIDAHGFDMDTGAFAKVADGAVDLLEKIPGVGKLASAPVKGVRKLAEANNNFLWQYLHPSIKLSTANALYSKALEGEAAKLLKNPSYKARSPESLMKEITPVVNDLFGGENWRQVSGEIENKFLHKLTSSVTNPEGLRTLRVALLAPDWLVSTVRSGVKGIKATAKGFIPGTKMSIAEDAYRRYFLGGALMTATIMEGLQQHFTGTSFLNNPDPTSVYLGDGRKIQVAKHFTEIFHWLRDPAGTMVNKLGYVPKEAAAQLLNKDYISAKGMPPMKDTSPLGRLEHAASGMLPISAQEGMKGNIMEGMSGALGVPIHGKTRADREAERRQRQNDSTERRRQAERNRRNRQLEGK